MEAFTDVMSGHLDPAIASMIDAMPLIQAGKIRAIAVTNLKRAPALPKAGGARFSRSAASAGRPPGPPTPPPPASARC
ncbi:MAG TPA: tripartite tricarboxylate transporter substrate-binding protein [Ramlibacter sp.]|nr:tripartite tricarboxylate transporter substrate-binding protein [Ramlibacter sp.]